MGLFNVKQPVVRPSYPQPAEPLVLIVRFVVVLLVTTFAFEPVESIVGYGSLQPEATFHHRQYRPQYRRRQVVTSCKPRHYHDWHPPLPIPPIPHFWTETASPHGQYQYEGNQQYSPVVRIVEPYSLPQRQFHKEEDKSGHYEQPSIKPSSDTTGSSSQEFYDPPQLPSNPYRENPEHPVIYRIQNNKKKKTRKRKKKPKQHKEYQGFVGTTPGYSVNKIIVIEESDIPKENNQQAGGNQAEKSSPQQPESQSEFNKNPFINIKDFYPKRPESNEHHHERGNQMTTSTTSNQNQLPIDHLVGSLPAKSIQEIHQRLNQTLMLNNSQGKNRHSSTQNRQQSHGTETLHTNANNLGVNLSRDSVNSTSPQAQQVPGTSGQPYMIKDTGQMTNYSDFFIKSNKFAYENSWNYLTSTSTESSTLVDSQQQQELNSDSLSSSKVNDRLISGNTPSRKWMSMSANSSTSSTTPSPPVYYFTSQRNFIPPPTTGTKPTTTSLQTSGSDKIFAARKRGQNVDPNHSGEPDSKSHTHKQHSKLDISKVATIIFGFCISMMVLAGLILVVLHKETVTERLRTLSESIETRYSNRFGRSNNRPPDSESGSNPGNDAHFHHHHQAHQHHHHHHPQHLQPQQQTHRQNRHPESQLPLAPPPPPPPPLPPLPPQLATHPQCVHTVDSEREPTPPPQQQNNRRINQDLIEEIIGRPENSFTNKKCRQYFSRVHRWVPKRPALPDNLKHISTNIDPNVTNEP